MESQRKSTPLSVDEVHTFLSLVAEERIQRELDGTTRNEKVFKEIAQLLAAHGYHRTLQQCRDKLKKLKSDYRAIKDHNGRSGANRKAWRWYGEMDAIYGRRPSNNGREGGLDSATSLLQTMIEDESLPTSEEISDDPSRSPSPTPAPPAAASTPVEASTSADSGPSTLSNTQRVVTGKRKRGLFQQDQAAVLREMQAEDVSQQEQNRAQRDNHIQLLLADARDARQLEATMRREESAQTAAFNQSFLGLLGQLVQAMSDRRT